VRAHAEGDEGGERERHDRAREAREEYVGECRHSIQMKAPMRPLFCARR
jgi:hypothetical protein